MAIRLNGWQRLWVVASVLWMLFMIWSAFDSSLTAKLNGWDVTPSYFLPAYALFGVIVPAVAYGTGMVVAWVIRGFRRGT